MHIPNPYYVEKEGEFVDEEFKESSLMRTSNMEMIMNVLSMKMLKIHHKDSWNGILHQPMIAISRTKI
jgi:hypothetical protein